MKAYVLRSFLDLSDSPELFEIRKRASKWSHGSWFPFNIYVNPSIADISLLTPPCLRSVPPPDAEFSIEKITRELIAGAVNEHISEATNILTEAPETALTLIFAVEHAVSLAGIKRALSKYPAEKLTVLVLDAHVDLFDIDERIRAAGLTPPPWLTDEKITSGNFLKTLLAELPYGTSVIIAGVREPVFQSETLAKSFREKTASRVKLIDASTFENSPGEAFDLIKNDLTGKILYLSIDADVACSEETGAVRFNNVQGLNRNILLELASIIRVLLSQKKLQLAGVDLTEIFPPFAELEHDRTIEFWTEFFNTLLSEIKTTHI